MTRRYRAAFLAAGLSLGAFAPALRAQSSDNPELGLLMNGVELRIAVQGVDSTQWYQAHVVFVHGDCAWFAIDHAGWDHHHLERLAKVPARERVVVPLRSVVAFRVAPFSLGVASPDTTSWTMISADSVRAKEPRRCLRE